MVVLPKKWLLNIYKNNILPHKYTNMLRKIHVFVYSCWLSEVIIQNVECRVESAVVVTASQDKAERFFQVFKLFSSPYVTLMDFLMVSISKLKGKTIPNVCANILLYSSFFTSSRLVLTSAVPWTWTRVYRDPIKMCTAPSSLGRKQN